MSTDRGAYTGTQFQQAPISLMDAGRGFGQPSQGSSYGLFHFIYFIYLFSAGTSNIASRQGGDSFNQPVRIIL
jgi:hypothetical protein